MRPTRLHVIAFAIVVCALSTAACSGASDGTQDPADDLYDPPVHESDAGPDDDLGALLEGGPIFPPDDAGESSDAGAGSDASIDTASKPADAPRCDSTAKSGAYCGGDKVSHGSAGTLYHCTGPDVPATVVEVCKSGCVVATGSDDYCKPTSATADSCPHVSAVLVWGLHPIASDRLRCLGIGASRIVQTIGSAAASAGTHAQDGTYAGHAYSAATDLSVSGLTDSQVKELLTRLDAMGFAAFYRNPGHDGWPSTEARHVHAVFAGAFMKSSLRAQIADFLAGKNGLASHTTYTFYSPPADVKAYVKKIFDAAN